MAVRRPLYWNGSDVQEMTDALIDELVDQCVYQYSTDPSVTMSVVSSSGTLDAMDDTRKFGDRSLYKYNIVCNQKVRQQNQVQ